MMQLSKVWAGYVQHELLYMTWGLMDVSLLTPVALAVMPWARYWPPGQVLIWLLLVMLLPFNLARLMSALQIPPSRQQTVMAASLLLTIVAVIRSLLHDPQSLFDLRWVAEFYTSLATEGGLWVRDFSVFVLIVLMWMRGIRLATRSFDVQRVGLRLRVGGLIFAPIAVWFGYQRALWDVTPFLLLFFLAGLTAIALIRAEEVERYRSGRSASLSPRWLSAVFAAGLLIVFVAGALAIITSGEPAVAVVGWLAPLWTALEFTMAVALTTFAYLSIPVLAILEPLFQLLIFILSSLLGPVLSQLTQLAPIETPGAAEEVNSLLEELMSTEGGIGTGGRLIILLLMLALVLVVALVLNRLYQQATLAAREGEVVAGSERESADEAGRGRQLLQRLGFLRRWRMAASIRRIYQQMLRAAAASGYPRAESETPYEYLMTLAKVWPEHRRDSQLITEAYVKVRYGEVPETREELDVIRRAWQRLEETRPVELDGDAAHHLA